VVDAFVKQVYSDAVKKLVGYPEMLYFYLKMHQNVPPGPAGGAYSTPPVPVARLKRKGREGGGKGRGRGGRKGEGRSNI